MKKLFPYLTYAGAIPFVICAVCLALGIHQLPMLGSVKTIVSVYGLIIASFLAGSHWGQHLHISQSPWGHYLPLFSNMIAVLLWVGFLLLNFQGLMGAFVVAFAALLVIDHRLFQQGWIAHHYFQTRCYVSVIVTISLRAFHACSISSGLAKTRLPLEPLAFE